MGILQARILEWVTVPSSRGPSRPRNLTWVSCIACRFFPTWATKEAQFKGTYKHSSIYCQINPDTRLYQDCTCWKCVYKVSLHIDLWPVFISRTLRNLMMSLSEEIVIYYPCNLSMATHSRILACAIPRWKSLVGSSPWGYKVSDTT